MARIVRTLLVSGAAVGLIFSAEACSCSVGKSNTASKRGVESQIAEKMTDVNGNHPDSVKCPSDLQAKVGATISCKMKLKGQSYTVNVTVTKVDGKDIKFDMVKVPD